MVESVPEQVIAEIDAVHLRIREAFRRRDLSSYMATFAADLEYRQPDGRVLSREELARSIARQFQRLVAFDSTFDRQSVSATSADITEFGTQTAWIALRVFILFAIRWKVERQGTYTWARVETEWLLRNASIKQERVTRAGFGLASRAGAV